MPQLYNLDDCLSDFFESQASISRQECDALAISLVGEPLVPVSIQGSFSYTVVAGPQQAQIVQFRAKSSILDMCTLSLAHKIHGRFMAQCTCHGNIGKEPSPLAVYTMQKLPGLPYIEARCTRNLAEPTEVGVTWQKNNVEDFARFFAQAWQNPQTMTPQVADALLCELQRRIDVLVQVLPQRFTRILTELRRDLPLLFTEGYPLVLTHDDLCEMNLLVDPDTGHISGIIDWADARVLPFGMALWGFENTLGYMDSNGWHYYPNHRELDSLFWRVFEDTVGRISHTSRRIILVAKTIGLFLRYGMTWEGGIEEPVEASDLSLRYLDALVLQNCYGYKEPCRGTLTYLRPTRKQ